MEEINRISESSDKLDIITDVQLILVEKYRRAAQLLWVAIGLLVLCGLGMMVGAAIGIDVQDKLVKLSNEQAIVLAEQRAAKVAAEEAKLKAAETKQEVTATKRRLDDAVEASPKIEIDARGKAHVVVPIATAGSKKKPSGAASSNVGSIELR